MQNIIGIVGGIGTQAGIDLFQKITNNTSAHQDQDYLEVYLLSRPLIPDRTAYILDHSKTNPALEIFTTIKKLHVIGANIIAIACNTAHSFSIFTEIKNLIHEESINIKLLNIVEETCAYLLLQKKPKAALLATLGTYQSNLYKNYFSEKNLDILYPDKNAQSEVHAAIYDKSYGIKSCSNPVQPKAIDVLNKQSELLVAQGATHIIAGCTEIPLATPYMEIKIPIVDPTELLAKACVKAAIN